MSTLQLVQAASYSDAVNLASTATDSTSILATYDYIDPVTNLETHGFVLGTFVTDLDGPAGPAPGGLTLTESQKFSESNFDEVTLNANNELEFKNNSTVIIKSSELPFVKKVTGKDLSTNDYSNSDKDIVDSVTTNLAGKVDKVVGKELSDNNYTDSDKTAVTNITSSLDLKVDKVSGKGLSTNDYSNADKAIVDSVSTELSNKVNKVPGKDLSTNDYSNADKAIVDSFNTELSNKVDKVSGKVLSDNNFSTAEKNKLASLETPLSKGYFSSLAALQAVDASPAEGSFGYVETGTPGEYKLYVFQGGAYVDKGVVNGSVTISQIKSLVEAEADVNFVTDDEKATLSTLDVDYVKVESGKGLSTNDLTDVRADKVDKIPTADNNTAGGLVTTDASGKISSSVLPSTIVTTSSGKIAETVIPSTIQRAESGKGLSTNDFTNTDKEKVDTIATEVVIDQTSDPLKPVFNFKNGTNIKYSAQLDLTVSGSAAQADWNEVNTNSKSFIKNKPDMSNYVLKQTGKGLSTNDLTDARLTYLTNSTSYAISVDNFKGKTINPFKGTGIPSLAGVLENLQLKVSDSQDHIWFRYAPNSFIEDQQGYFWSKPFGEGGNWAKKFKITGDWKGKIPFLWGAFNDAALNAEMNAVISFEIENSFYVKMLFEQHSNDNDRTLIVITVTRVVSDQ